MTGGGINGRWETVKTQTRYTTYKRHGIITEAITSSGSWSVEVRIIDGEGRRVVSACEVVFATEVLAHRAGLIVARSWIDARDSARGITP